MAALNRYVQINLFFSLFFLFAIAQSVTRIKMQISLNQIFLRWSEETSWGKKSNRIVSNRLTRIASLASFSMQLTHLALGVRSQSCYLKVFSQSNAHIVLRKHSNPKKEHSLERNETTLVPQLRYENDSGIPRWVGQISSFLVQCNSIAVQHLAHLEKKKSNSVWNTVAMM